MRIHAFPPNKTKYHRACVVCLLHRDFVKLQCSVAELESLLKARFFHFHNSFTGDRAIRTVDPLHIPDAVADKIDFVGACVWLLELFAGPAVIAVFSPQVGPTHPFTNTEHTPRSLRMRRRPWYSATAPVRLATHLLTCCTAELQRGR